MKDPVLHKLTGVFKENHFESVNKFGSFSFNLGS